MKSALRYLAVGAIAYLLFVAATFPAAHVTPLVEERAAGLMLGDVQGSVFSGSAGRAAWQDIDLGRLEWRFRPLALLGLRLEYDVQFAAPVNRGTARAGIRPGKRYASDVQVQLESTPMINRFATMNMTAAGVFDLQLDSLEHDGTAFHAVSGKLQWRDAALTAPISLQLGTVAMNLEQQDDALVGAITRGGVLGLGGDITLAADRRYALDLTLRPDSSVPPDVLGMLETFAQQQADGSLGLKLAGSY